MDTPSQVVRKTMVSCDCPYFLTSDGGDCFLIAGDSADFGADLGGTVRGASALGCSAFGASGFGSLLCSERESALGNEGEGFSGAFLVSNCCANDAKN